jgi:6-phosphofructokinase 1
VRWQTAQLLRDMEIEALVVIGGDGSLTGAHLLEQETGFPVIGLPGTIDNDVAGTEETIGFDTAVNTALEAIDRIRDTANSHDRLFLVEVMGRNTGFIAEQVGIAGGAELILVPDQPQEIDSISQVLQASQEKGKASSIVVVAEGEPGSTQELAQQLVERGHEPRVCILGHIQRGGGPTGHDRVLASCLGAMAIRYLQAGVSDVMVAVQHNAVVSVPLEEIIGQRKPDNAMMLEVAAQLRR